MKSPLRRSLPLVTAALTALTPVMSLAAAVNSGPHITPDPAIAQYAVPASAEPNLTTAQEISLLRTKVKYVFVLYQENRSFDSYFGTFPGADGLFSQPPSKTPGFYQRIINTNGTTSIIHPFRIEPTAPDYSSDTDDIDHSHPLIVKKMDIVNGEARMDQYALTEERKYSPTSDPSLKAKQYGELAMAYEDGDTIPFLWQYANRFVLFDHIFQEMAGPSTPGNLAIIGAQTGTTQLMLHPSDAYSGNGASGPGVPVLNDSDPFWGSQLDVNSTLPKMPVNPGDFIDGKEYGTQMNLTFATLPLTLAGKTLSTVTGSDTQSASDLADIQDDIPFITEEGLSPIPWGWYEEGFDREPTDPAVPSGDPVDAEGSHASYVTHHNGPQFFGYISNNPIMRDSLHGLQDFDTALTQQTLPATGGIFYVKGGFQNILSLKPADPNAAVQSNFQGDDDHPGYSDAEISEAQIATEVNEIAASSYWKNCAIIITWDDSEGDYDHVQPNIQAYGPDGSIISDGPRVPLLVISPYARTNAIAHSTGDQASVVKFADMLFGLTPLADLPDELAGRTIGLSKGLINQGPFDDITQNITNLLTAFDPARLDNLAAPLPSTYAEIPMAIVTSIPPVITTANGTVPYGLAQIGILPTDYSKGIINQVPSDFNPRPSTDPGLLNPAP